MPKLWTETIDAHRQAVRDAAMDATAALVAEQGLASVTMSRIAEQAGIGRATLYKYFPDVASIVQAWHERQVSRHLQQLSGIQGQGEARLAAVLEAYAFIQHEHDGGHLETALHQGEHLGHARRHLHQLIRDLLSEQATNGRVRTDVPADELAAFCLQALTAAARLPSKAAVRRLVAVVLDALRGR